MNSPVRLGVSPAAASTPTDVYSQRFLRFSFPMLEPWVAWSISLPSCSSQFTCTQMWDGQPPPCLLSSLLLLPVWMNVSYLTRWLSDFHTIRLSGSSGCFLVLNLLSFFWLCKEGKCIYLHLHLGWKSHFNGFYQYVLFHAVEYPYDHHFELYI